MRVVKLIKKFNDRDDLPIDVNDVVSFIREEQIKDNISFVGVDIDTSVLRGSIFQYVLPGLAYGEPQICADIYFDKQQPPDWQRFVCCKELLHILDSEAQRAAG